MLHGGRAVTPFPILDSPTRVTPSRLIRDESGVALVEFAFVLPLLLVLVLGIIDFGRAFNHWIDTTHLANVAARYATVNKNPGASSQTLQQYIQAQRIQQTPVKVCVSFPDRRRANVGDAVEVTVSSTWNWLEYLVGRPDSPPPPRFGARRPCDSRQCRATTRPAARKMSRLRDILHDLRQERGGVLVLVAIAMPVLIGCTGLAIDVGNWFEHRRHLQTQADAAALAAAGDVRFPCDASVNAAVDARIEEYGKTRNPQVGATPPDQVEWELNSRHWPRQPTMLRSTTRSSRARRARPG